MKRAISIWREDDGVLSFEWVLLLTLLTIGIISGVAAARDAVIDELGDVAEAAISIDQSYSLAGFVIPMVFETPDQEFVDDIELFEDCERTAAPAGQGPSDDIDS